MKIGKNVLSAYFDKKGNIPRGGPKHRCSDCLVFAISILAEFEGIDSENRLIAILQEHKRDFPHRISRRQYNDRRRTLLPYCTKVQHLLTKQVDDGEDYFRIDSKSISVCRLSRSKRCRFGRGEGTHSPDWGYCVSQQTFWI